MIFCDFILLGFILREDDSLLFQMRHFVEINDDFLGHYQYHLACHSPPVTHFYLLSSTDGCFNVSLVLTSKTSQFQSDDFCFGLGSQMCSK